MENEIGEAMENLNLNSEGDINSNIEIKGQNWNNKEKEEKMRIKKLMILKIILNKWWNIKTRKKRGIKQKEKINIPLKSKRTFKSEDFEIISLSGKRAYGTVLKATLKSDLSNQLYTIKVMDIKALCRIKSSGLFRM